MARKIKCIICGNTDLEFTGDTYYCKKCGTIVKGDTNISGS